MSEDHDSPDTQGPPPPPEVRRRVMLHGAQWIGIPLLMLVPVLALLGVFGESRRHAEAGSDVLRVEVDYPQRHRTGLRSDIVVRLRNVSSAPLDGVSVAFDPAYFSDAFNVLFNPPASAPHEVALPVLEPGAEDEVRVEFEAEHRWWRRGWIRVTRDGRAVAELRIGTFVLP
jgi:hypothetical protein